MSDKELRDSGKLSRPVITPIIGVAWGKVRQVPLRFWLWALIVAGLFFVGRIVLREVREDAKNYVTAELAEKHRKEVQVTSDHFEQELSVVRKTNSELLKKLDADSTKTTTVRQASKATTAKKKATVLSHTTVAAVSQDVQEFLKVFPVSVTDTTLTFDVRDVPKFVVTALEVQDLQLEVEFQKHMRGIAEQRVTILEDTQAHSDATIIALKDTNKALETEAAAFKKAAKKSTWRKFLGGVKTTALVVIPAAVMYLVMSGEADGN